MNTINNNQLLMQLRIAAMQAQSSQTNHLNPVAAPSASPSAMAAPGSIDKASFSALLKESMGNVNQLQQRAASARKAFELGDPNMTLPDVMIAKSKSSLAFEGMLQVRNKLIEAYSEVKRMPV
ncbi:MAG: flagellar hook-basal body complex protein FliE [Gammaproteobacteria bacterium]|nr:flagellar hook-basal body complex protein FliE [Gammaproteobacteria bacterium]